MNPARDVRQQLPFSQNPAAPYVPTPFQSSQNRAPYPPSHPPASQRTYRQEAPSNHVRHHVISSACHGTSSIPKIPPLSSPQHVPSRPHQSYVTQNCAPHGSVGTHTNYSGSRELPALPSKGSTRAGGMAIADILGDPSSHEVPLQYSPPVKTSGPMYNTSTTLASPRLNSSRPLDYPYFRGPQTPEHPAKQFDPRENKGSTGSPRQLNNYQTPEAQRFSTPQQTQQSYSRPGLIREERRDPFRITNSNVPCRPKSQPSSFNISQSRDPDRPPVLLGTAFGRRIDPFSRPTDSSNYGRTTLEERERENSFIYPDREQRERISDQQRDQNAIAQREREKDRNLEKQITIQREKEQREQQEHKRRLEQESSQREYVQQVVERNFSFNQQPKPRERPVWTQPRAYEPPQPALESIAEREASISRRSSNGYELPTTAATFFPTQPSYTLNENRYCPNNSTVSRKNSVKDDPIQERRATTQQQYQQKNQQPVYGTSQNGVFQSHESSTTRPIEEPQSIQQRSFLGVQEINRKGRISPLPQAVQGAQTQADGPSGEPSIKNEFGRMFSGIGSGVGSVLQDPSPTSAQNYAAISGFRREDLEVLQELQNIYKPQSVHGTKRRKVQEDKKDEENNSAQISPSGKVKRTKIGHHHHRRAELPENVQCSSHLNLTPFKSSKGALSSLQDQVGKNNSNMHHHHVPTPHHHHHHHHHPNQASSDKDHTVTPLATSMATVYLPKLSIHNDAVLNSVSSLPRHHLGNGYYSSTLRVSSNSLSLARDTSSNRGFASVPDALPRFIGRENCTYTVKISRVYLEESAREEVTSRKALWGTDIYTDDSDILAACIHAGWFRGAWSENIDVSMLGLELKNDENGNPIPPDEIMPGQLLESPSDKGPGHIPSGCECHVTILVLPLLDKYASSTRFGIKSREWGFKRDGLKSVHDGLSFMIKSIRFVTGVDGEEGRSKRSRRKIVGKQLQEKRENYQSDSRDQNKIDRFGEMKGLGKGGWWKRKNSAAKSKQNMLADDGQASTGPVEKLDPPNVTISKCLGVSGATVGESNSHVAATDASPLTSTDAALVIKKRTFIDRITQRMLKNANNVLS
ncbi:hypothetical protein K3495_g3232 [Podosphaera aphanis]|nr:hypothetical protein K3495_g3232 [Podosphaera aphanis]